MDKSGIESLVEGNVYDLKVAAKDPNGEGIGRINNIVVFVRNTSRGLERPTKSG